MLRCSVKHAKLPALLLLQALIAHFRFALLELWQISETELFGLVFVFPAYLLIISNTLVVGLESPLLLLFDVNIVESLSELLVYFSWLDLFEVNAFEKGVTL